MAGPYPPRVDWTAHLRREQERYDDGEKRLPDAPDDDTRQRQLTRLGNAAGGAGLALLMLRRDEEAAEWFDRAVRRYRESYEHAPPGSWGRPIGGLKARVLAGDWSGAAEEARWALDEGAAESDSPIGRYAAALALLTLGRDEDARPIADSIRERDDFPHDVANALATIAAEDRLGYVYAVESVLESFEQRDEYLEDIPVADTVIVLQALAARRDLAADLDSELLPG
jgi:tetratricopeptide (TPR) repeat protein